MNSIEDMVRYISIRYEDKIKAICAPLYNTFNINHFFLSCTTKDGRFFSIGSNLKMHEYYYCAEKYTISPVHRNPASILPGLYSYYDSTNTAFQESIDDVKKSTNVFLAIGIASKINGTLIRFGYGIDPSKGNPYHHTMLLTKNIPLLESFNVFFLKEAETILKNAADYSFDLVDKLGDLYYQNSNPLSPLDVDLNTKVKLLKDIGIFPSNEKLSTKECEHLEYIGKGFPASLIAQIMHRSPRTIENSIERLKHKLQCKNKSDLIAIARLIEKSSSNILNFNDSHLKR